MPERLMMAAEIMLDVARTTSDAHRWLLEAAAAELAVKAIALAAEQGRTIDGSAVTAVLLLAGGRDGSDHRPRLLVH